MFARQRDPGLWTIDSVVAPSEFEYWDAHFPHALDATNGGAWSLANDVTIGGDPFVAWVFELETSFNEFSSFTASVLFGDGVTMLDTLDAQGVADFGDLTTFADTATFNGDLVANNGVYLGSSSADALIVAAQGLFQSNVEFANDVLFSDVVTLDDDMTCDGNAFLNGSVVLGASSTQSLIIQAKASLRAPLKMSGTGAILQRSAMGPDSDASFSPLACRDVIILNGTISGTVHYTIDDTDCEDDNEIVFINKDQTNSMVIKRPGGTTITGITGKSVRCKRVSGTWYGMEYGDTNVL